MATKVQKMPEHQMKPYTCGRLARGRTAVDDDVGVVLSAILNLDVCFLCTGKVERLLIRINCCFDMRDSK